MAIKMSLNPRAGMEKAPGPPITLSVKNSFSHKEPSRIGKPFTVIPWATA